MDNTHLKRSLGWLRRPAIALALIAALLFYVPVAVVIATSWTEGSFIQFPPEGFSTDWYSRVVQDAEWINALQLSIWISAAATLIAVLMGTLGALASVRVKSDTVRRLIRTLFIVPIAVPPVAYAVGLYSINVQIPGLSDTWLLMIIGEALLALPYVFVVVSTGLANVDPALRPAASTLGANWPEILWRVDLPLVKANVLSGVILAFAVVFDEVVLSVFLAPVGVRTLPLQMLSASQEALSPELSAVSTLISVLAIVVLGGLSVIVRARAARVTETV